MSEGHSAATLFADPAPCCTRGEGCMCGREERVLRAVIAGQYRPLTSEERAWCTREIASVEGCSESDGEGSDADAARMVLNAWVDYCRDKGLL